MFTEKRKSQKKIFIFLCVYKSHTVTWLHVYKIENEHNQCPQRSSSAQHWSRHYSLPHKPQMLTDTPLKHLRCIPKDNVAASKWKTGMTGKTNNKKKCVIAWPNTVKLKSFLNHFCFVFFFFYAHLTPLGIKQTRKKSLQANDSPLGWGHHTVAIVFFTESYDAGKSCLIHIVTQAHTHIHNNQHNLLRYNLPSIFPQ